MGLGIAIAGSISVAAMFLVMTIIPSATDKFVDSIEIRSQISEIQKKLDNTLFEITSLTADAGADVFGFDLTNTGTQKIWNYDKMNFLVTYDADISGTKTRLVESFTYNEQASFLGVSTNQFGRPIQDIAVGGWTSTPLYGKLNETIRNDQTFVTSPLSISSPTNNATVKLDPVDDPETGFGHILRYTYKSELIAANKGVLGYGEDNALNGRYMNWTGSSFGPEGSVSQIIPLATDIQWVVVRSSPTTVEKVMGFVVASTNTLYINTWNGATWTSNWSTLIGNSDTRHFDIAYEGNSGDVIVVFGDGTSQLKFRKRVSGTWDTLNGNAGSALANFPKWVVAKSSPVNDDIFVAVNTQATTLTAMRWDGTANTWGNQNTTTTPPMSRDYQCFDIAFERSTGHALLIWGPNSSSLLYKKFTTSWQSEITAYSGLVDKIRWVVAEGNRRNPSSNEIAVGMSADNNNYEFGAWTGSSWVTRPSSISAADKDNRGISVGFDRSNDKAMFVFATGAVKKQMSWRTWTSEGGFSSITLQSGVSDDIRWIQLRPDPLSNKIMVLYYDRSGDLFHRVWDGSSWSSLGAALELTMSVADKKESFMYAWDNVPVTTLTVQLLQGQTVIAQWNEGNIYGTTSWVQKDRRLTSDQADSITDYSDLRVGYVGNGNQLKWSWAEFQVSSFPGDANEWGINNIGEDSLEPRILNPGETATILAKLPYPPYLGGIFTVTVITDSGRVISDSITIS
jgi:hypothetical protein